MKARIILTLGLMIALSSAAFAQNNGGNVPTVNELRKEISLLKKDTTALRAQIAKLEKEIAELKKENAKLEPFKATWLDYLANNYNKPWEDKLYSQIDTIALQQDIDMYKIYALDDNRLARAIHLLKELQDQTKLFQKGWTAVREPYDEAKIKKLTPEIKTLRDRVENTPRGAEVVDVHRQLRDYRVMLRFFQDLIKEVDKELEGITNHNGGWAAIKDILKSREADGTVNSIRSIPWLDKQYDIYYRALHSNCVGENPAKKRIMDIKL